jgi:hypothetical protein
MLKQLLKEIAKADSAIDLNELSRKLDVDRSALEGMIAYLVQKGKLRDDEKAQAVATGSCGSGSCDSCCGAQGCPFVVKTPRTFSLPPEQEE